MSALSLALTLSHEPYSYTETQVSPMTSDSHSQQVAEGSSLELRTSSTPWALLQQFA